MELDKLKKIENVAKELLKNTRVNAFKKELYFALHNPGHNEEEIVIVCQMIAKDGYDITGFGLDQIPADGVYCFYNPTTNQAFDVWYLEDLEEPHWSFMYGADWIGDANCFPAETIKEAVEKYIVE